jgi:hypothetical protein
MVVDTLREQIIGWVSAKPDEYPWAVGLPSKTLDIEAMSYINSANGDPTKLIESANPFDVSERLKEITSLFELLSRLRADSFSKETALISQVLDEKLAMESAKFESDNATVALEADWKSAGKAGPAPVANVSEIFELHKQSRKSAQKMRSLPGHPANLLEQINELRRRYIEELRTLLGRSESTRLTLQASFGISVKSLYKALPADRSPIPAIGDWLRSVSEGLEVHALNSRVVTVYRFVNQDGWLIDGDLTPKLAAINSDVECTLTLSKASLGVQPDETARILAYGVAPSYGKPKDYIGGDEANRDAAFINNLRAIARQTSYDIGVRFSPVRIQNEFGAFDFPEVDEKLYGIPGWSIDMGAAEEALILRTTDMLKNRPIGGKVTIHISNIVRNLWTGVSRHTPLSTINVANIDFAAKDILFAIRYVATKNI